MKIRLVSLLMIFDSECQNIFLWFIDIARVSREWGFYASPGE